MLTLTRLRNVEYLLGQVAEGIEDYYLGAGEAPGVWWGQWADDLGLSGIVEAEDLRALIKGHDPRDGTDWLAGHRKRQNLAVDATFSPPKSVSLLAAFASPEVKTRVMLAHAEAVDVALGLLENKAAVARQQDGGNRVRQPTAGFAVATFVHRTSRAGDPQLHTHCVIPNVARRPDGSHVALDGGQLWEWKRAVGCVYQEELRRRLTERLGVRWEPDRNGTREIVGFTRPQLRQFSKRSEDIEMKLAQMDVDPEDRAAWMHAGEWASLFTRTAKDRSLTPERLKETWGDEAAEVGLPTGEALVATVCDRDRPAPVLDGDIVERLLDPDEGVCARQARFSEAHVVEAIASYGAGQLDIDRILQLAQDFLGSEHVVRLADRSGETGRPRPPEWSTRIHLAMERRALDHLEHLAARTMPGLPAALIGQAIRAETVELGADQRDVVQALCNPGPALRGVIAPPGYGKTTMTHAAASAQVAAGRHVLGIATTNRAVNELRDVGVPATTIARLLLELRDQSLAANTTLIIDEISQVATRDLLAVLDHVVDVPGVQVWCVGDGKQTKAVKAGGLATELERLTREGRLPEVVLTENRRQQHPAERNALARYRDADVAASQTIRTEHGWEHDCGTPAATRQAMAAAIVADGDRHGIHQVAAFAVTHADCEDLADRIRAIRQTRGQLLGPSISSPGWGDHDRHYSAGDLVLLHRRFRSPAGWVHNGTTLTITSISDNGLTVSDPTGHRFTLPRSFVEGRTGRTPNISHGWARTVDGSQGGSWTQVHLLGSAALNRYSGLVGQSRSRLPTHTWNVTRLVDLDHGGALADDRTPAEEVLDALRLEPDTAFAVHADPYQLDRQLTAERHAHLAADPNRTQGWRRERIAEIDHQLQHHWAQAVLAVAEQGDPLAYGLERLRAARHTIFNQLDTVIASIPLDRSEQLRRAQQELDRSEETVRYAQRQTQIAQARLDTAQPRRFSRTDKPALAEAQQQLENTRNAFRKAELRFATARHGVQSEKAAAAERHDRLTATRDERTHLAADLRLLNDGLEHTRHDRVVAAALGAPEGARLRDLLGYPPDTQAGLDLWCAIADRIETYWDRGSNSQTHKAIEHLIARAPELLAHAHRLDPTPASPPSSADQWVNTLAVAEQRHQVMHRRAIHQPDRGFGLEL